MIGVRSCLSCGGVAGRSFSWTVCVACGVFLGVGVVRFLMYCGGGCLGLRVNVSAGVVSRWLDCCLLGGSRFGCSVAVLVFGGVACGCLGFFW